MILHTFGVGKRQLIASELIRASASAEAYDEIFLLPIPSSRDKIHLTDTDIPLADLCRERRGRVLIAGYGIPLDFTMKASALGFELADVGCDERFLRDNAELTAHGTVGYILTREERAVGDLRIGIVGYGRIGRFLSRLLLFLGAETVIFTRREQTRLELCGMGIESASAESIKDAERLDYLINTAPARLIDESGARALLGRGTQILELASGDNLPLLSGIVRLPSIPDRSYPVSAGRIFAEAVLRHIERTGENG